MFDIVAGLIKTEGMFRVWVGLPAKSDSRSSTIMLCRIIQQRTIECMSSSYQNWIGLVKMCHLLFKPPNARLMSFCTASWIVLKCFVAKSEAVGIDLIKKAQDGPGSIQSQIEFF